MGERSVEGQDRDLTFAEQIEQRAREAVSARHDRDGRWSPSWLLKDEIALTLDQIEGLRFRGRRVELGLLEEECGIGTELMQMEQRTPRYSPYRFPEREKLQRRRGQLSQERRRFRISEAEKLDGLHEKLLGLVGKEGMLRILPGKALRTKET